ncbi:MAG TPA: M28 family peptidase [Terriglobales bacterium]|nr:M28 family peptidase [Terriglobales bacterium]
MALLDWERQLLDDVSRDRLMGVTNDLAQWVRHSGTPPELEAAEHLRRLLDGWGLRTELLAHDAYISLPVAAHLETEDGVILPCITHSFSASTGVGGVDGELADGTAGTVDPAGRIALLPGLAGPGPVRAAEAAGAVAQVYVNGPITHEMIVSPVWGSPGSRNRDRLPRTPVVSVTDETAAAIRARLADGRLRLRVFTEVDTGWRRTPLLLAHLDGASEDFVLFSGHLDSWHRGAMDNGSANATMMEVGRVLAGEREPRRRGLLLAFWSGHSHGRYSGSAWFADERWWELSTRCVAHVNVDSVGGRGATRLSSAVTTASLRHLGAAAIRDVTGEEFTGSRVGRAGDQSFLGHGVPSLWMSLSEQPDGGLGWWWHTPEDTVDKIDPDLLLRDARIYALAVARLVAAPALPLDLAAEASEVVDRLRELKAAAGLDGFDLAAAAVRAEELLSLAGRIELRRSLAHRLPAAAAAFDRAVMAVLRPLVAAGYTSSGPWEPDPALAVAALPVLDPVRRLADVPPDSDEARFLRVDLTRARNRVVAALETALAAARNGLAELDALE